MILCPPPPPCIIKLLLHMYRLYIKAEVYTQFTVPRPQTEVTVCRIKTDAEMFNQLVSGAVGHGDASARARSLAILHNVKTRCISNQMRYISDSWHLVLSKPICQSVTTTVQVSLCHHLRFNSSRYVVCCPMVATK